MAAVSGEEIVDKGTRLAGKVAIVTGGGSSGELVGTGQAAAILFARQGARVLVVDRDPANAGEDGGDHRSRGRAGIATRG